MISFFGASVTQQKTGYVPEFKKLINTDVNQHGYGSMHINDAGMCFIEDVIINKPKYCFIDWFSASIHINLVEYLDTFLYKFTQINCKLIFLLLDRNPIEEKRIEMYNTIKNYCFNHNIKYIELYNNPNVSEILRDRVHTTDIGSVFYAKKIYDFYINELLNKEYIHTNIPEPTKYSNIKKIEVNQIINDKIIFKGPGKIMGIYQIIGRNSGIVKITSDKITKYNLWDQWCHYSRQTIKINMDVKDELIIELTNESFDGSTCKESLDWKKFEKNMDIKTVFYIGDISIEYIK